MKKRRKQKKVPDLLKMNLLFFAGGEMLAKEYKICLTVPLLVLYGHGCQPEKVSERNSVLVPENQRIAREEETGEIALFR